MIMRGVMAGGIGALAAFDASPAWAEWLRDGIVIYAEPALQPPLAALNARFMRQHPGTPQVFTAPPTQMLSLLAHGTQADILITQTGFMDRALAAGLVAPAPHTLWRNRLVLAAKAGTAAPQTFSPDAVRALLGGGALAVPDATQASTVDGPALVAALGLSEHVQGAVDTADALAMVRAGAAALAVCHASEIAGNGAFAQIMALPESAYPAIIYQAALTKSAWSRNQMALLDYFGGHDPAPVKQLGLEYAA